MFAISRRWTLAGAAAIAEDRGLGCCDRLCAFLTEAFYMEKASLEDKPLLPEGTGAYATSQAVGDVRLDGQVRRP
jgi:hypothetical protein